MMGFLKRRLDVLDRMDPARIYVENVRAFLGVNTKVATWLCDKAVRDGYFSRWYAFEHPQLFHTVWECSADNELDEHKVVVDDTAEALGYAREYSLADLRQVEFFKRGA